MLKSIDEDERLVARLFTAFLIEQKMWRNGLKKEMGIQFQEK